MPPFQEYDPNTGQVFQQRDVPVPRIMSSSWNWATKPVICSRSTSSRLSVCVPRKSGATSLVELCLKAFIRHIKEIDKVHLQYLPTQLVGRIWNDLERISPPSVETWKLMATRLSGDEEATKYISPLLMRYLTSVEKIQPLAAYIEPLVSNTFDFLAHLTIAGKTKGNTHELLNLVQLKNLAVLEFIQRNEEDNMWESPRLTDSVLREWSEMPNPFPVLRVLRVWANDFTTRHSLRYIDAFPSMVLYDVAGRKRDWAVVEGEESNWKLKKGKGNETSHAISGHFYLLDEDVPNHQWKLNPETAFEMGLNPLHTLEKLETELTPFPRGNCEAYYDICNATKNAVTCSQSPTSRNTSYFDPSLFLATRSLWGFLVYCHIGRLILDRDLLAQGLDIHGTAFASGSTILAPRPTLQLVLADEDYNQTGVSGWADYSLNNSGSSRHARRSFETGLTFIRKDYHLEKRKASGSTTETQSAKRTPKTSGNTHRPLKKRKDVSSILESFNQR